MAKKNVDRLMVVKARKGDHGEWKTKHPVKFSWQAKEEAIKQHPGFKGFKLEDLFARKFVPTANGQQKEKRKELAVA